MILNIMVLIVSFEKANKPKSWKVLLQGGAFYIHTVVMCVIYS